ncbi:dihydrofolate reductase family protein [Glycomyces luteolus]|uniref:Dihydrofolate reductase family protein n=1 Tax=Glycomyces luteolus TaxID=2670330 RepID=A0A9X3SQE7_9ACTN|nr:dihydrofolate reductase family protein [Glycomyces luteolus]MDA1358829.1 dihydrofolate reductase family protein [Glycomyces luteolus]
MGRVRVDLNISLDGYATTTDQTPEDPFGQDWGRLVAAYVATKTMQERVMGRPGEGSTGMDNDYAEAYFEGIGAEIMGAGMFGLHAHPGDPDWKGWWGPNPPFGVPVFVLTHEQRPTLEMEGGTTFHFVQTSIEETLASAREAAGDLDVRIGGGARVAKAYLKAGLVDRLHVAVAPILLGRGENLWAGLREFEQNYEVTSEVAPSGTIHVTFAR